MKRVRDKVGSGDQGREGRLRERSRRPENKMAERKRERKKKKRGSFSSPKPLSAAAPSAAADRHLQLCYCLPNALMDGSHS